MLLALLLIRSAGLPAAAPEGSFSFQEVYELLKANLAGTTEDELNRAAVRGLLSQLQGKVSVVGESTPPAPTNSSQVTSSVFENRFGYLRLPRLLPDTPAQFNDALREVSATNKLKGLVLDLRFTFGQDYSAAVAVADHFLTNSQPIVDWGEGWKNSTTKSNAVTLALAILVNGKTSGAAEVLAGILRHRGVGLLLGTNTAGQASMAKEFTLKSGQRLRVAIAPVKLADNRELPFTGLKPDIIVEVAADDELAWYEDAFKPLTRAGRLTGAGTNDLSALTNRQPRRRSSEAELVRAYKEGQAQDRLPVEPLLSGAPPSPRLPEAALLVNDPVLARALDLLKGLSVVQQFRSP
jgi:hypothetical protein